MADSTSARRALSKELRQLGREIEGLRRSYKALFRMQDEVRNEKRDIAAEHPETRYFIWPRELSEKEDSVSEALTGYRRGNVPTLVYRVLNTLTVYNVMLDKGIDATLVAIRDMKIDGPDTSIERSLGHVGVLLKDLRKTVEPPRAKRSIPRKSNADIASPGDRIAAERRQWLDDYLAEVWAEKSIKITRTDVWKAAGYKNPTQFERWQRNARNCTVHAKRRIEGVLKDKPHLK